MKQIYSHTLVKNGQPFIGLVLQQVLPYAEKMLITISEKTTDGTEKIIQNLAEWNPGKIKISYENVANPADLTKERQKQLDLTPDGKWILFLDDDDYWPTKSLEQIVNSSSSYFDALACNPFQVIDKNYYDLSWTNKWFTKWFLKQPGLVYKHPWPKDLLYLHDQLLYWKNNERVHKATMKYFHLSNIKYTSFRKEKGFEHYHKEPGQGYFIPEIYKEDMNKIYGYLK